MNEHVLTGVCVRVNPNHFHVHGRPATNLWFFLGTENFSLKQKRDEYKWNSHEIEINHRFIS